MRIVRATTINETLQMLPIEQEIRKKEKEIIPLKDALISIAASIEDPNFGFWIAYDDNNEIIGFMILTIIQDITAKTLQIHRVWYKQTEKEVLNQFLKTGRKWAKDNNIKRVVMLANRRIKAIQRKWKFKPIAVIMERRIY